MKVTSFSTAVANALRDHLDKQLLMTDIQKTISEGNDIYIQSYDKAVDRLKTNQFNSTWANDKQKRFVQLTTLRDTNMFVTIDKVLKKIVPTVESLQSFFADKSGIEPTELELRTTNALQLYYVCRFYLDYARDFLLLFYSYESQVSLDEDRITPPLIKSEILELEQRFAVFCEFTKYFYQNYKVNLIDTINKLPDVIINEKSASVIDAQLGKNASIFQANKVTQNFFGDPRWWVVDVISSMQDRRYRRAEMAVKSITLMQLQLDERKRELENSSSNMSDPAYIANMAAIDKELSYNNGRLRDATRELQKVKAKYNV